MHAALCIQMQPPRTGWMSTWRFPHTTSLSSPYFTYLEESQDISGIWHDFIIHPPRRQSQTSQPRMKNEWREWRLKTEDQSLNITNRNVTLNQAINRNYNTLQITYDTLITWPWESSNRINNQPFKSMKQDGTLHIEITISHAYFGFSSPSKHGNINI